MSEAVDFGALVRSLRLRAGRSRNGLALEAGVDPSYLARIELNERAAPRPEILDAVARSLHLSPFDRNRLLVAAGHAPVSIRQLGGWDEGLQWYCDVMTDFELSSAEKQEFRRVVGVLAAKWLAAKEGRAEWRNGS